MTILIITLLFAHFLGDFVFQSDWMARNKNKNIKALSYHIFTYVTVLFVCLSFISYLFTNFYLIFIFIGINGLAHFTTDFITSKITTHFYKNEQIHNFFVVIGLDQLIHYITFLLTIKFLLP